MTSHCAVRQSVLSFIFQFNLPPHVTLCPRASDQLIVIPSVLNIRWWFRGFCELSNYTSVNYIKFTDPHSLSLPWSFFLFQSSQHTIRQNSSLILILLHKFCSADLVNEWLSFINYPASEWDHPDYCSRPTHWPSPVDLAFSKRKNSGSFKYPNIHSHSLNWILQ